VMFGELVGEAVYVFHAFKKKSKKRIKTPQRDMAEPGGLHCTRSTHGSSDKRNDTGPALLQRGDYEWGWRPTFQDD
jgi:hypothetical protein